MSEAPQLTQIRIDDIPLLLGVLMQMGIPQLYNQVIGDHGLHTGLSGGWMVTIWIAFILSQADHTKYKVEAWVGRHQPVLERVTGQAIVPSEFNDNRLSRLLSRLSQPQRWERFEAALWQHSLTVYELAPPSVGELRSAHVDSTTACGHHRPHEGGLMQRGHSKDHRPDLAQLKLMTVAVHPHGHLAATQVTSGNRADDGLYLPIIARVRQFFGRVGVLYVGDAKMAALQTRAAIAGAGDYYLTVAPMTGETARDFPAWIEAALSGKQPTETLSNEEGETIGRGYEFVRTCTAEVPSGQDGATTPFRFSERVQIFRSEALAAQQAATLGKRLENAAAELRQLTPEPGRGRRQYRDQASLQAAINETLEKHRVEGLLRVNWKVETHRQQRYVGRGRGSARREQREVVTQRYQITGVKRDEKAIAAQVERLGWRLQLSNAPRSLSLTTSVAHYRQNWRGERNYHRLKSEPLGIDAIYVRNDDQIAGLTYLLTLAARVESVIEYQVGRGLKEENKQMKGLYAGLPQKATTTPTAVALLSAISRAEITVTQLVWHGETTTHLTPLPELLLDVLRYLHLPESLYTGLKSNSAFDISIFGK
jgi:transposase